MSKRRALQAEWLEIWRLAGFPALSTLPKFMTGAGLEVIILKSKHCDCGIKDYMLVKLGDYDVTKLFAALAGSRGQGCKLYQVGGRQAIMRYSSKDCGRGFSEWLVASQAIELHAAAAKALLDVDAYRATGLPLPPAMEERLLDARLARPPISSNGAAAL